jgi:hypothetical protein
MRSIDLGEPAGLRAIGTTQCLSVTDQTEIERPLSSHFWGWIGQGGKKLSRLKKSKDKD